MGFYMRGNATEIEDLLQAKPVKKLINRDEKMAIGLNGLVLFLTSEENKKVISEIEANKNITKRIRKLNSIKTAEMYLNSTKDFENVCSKKFKIYTTFNLYICHSRNCNPVGL